MNENKLNPLLDAMSEIDDSIITNTKKTKKRPLWIVAAAAATATLLLTGAAVAVRNIHFKSGFYIGDDDGFELPYKVPENMSIPPYEELIEMWESKTYAMSDTGNGYGVALYVSPDEFAETCKIPLLTSDNFTDEGWVSLMTSIFEDEYDHINIRYALIHNNGGERMNIVADCFINDETQVSSSIDNLERTDYEKLTLNDGSEGIIYRNNSPYVNECYATFVRDGIIYWILADPSNTGIYTGIDDMKQILTDLGVL